ncbi:ribosome recycling factor [Marinilabiliaceae bacterium JC017]|nr:ribosome recycling factor [Marinilabiliaceae bacterium JC017]
MQEDIELIIEDAKERMEKALVHLDHELGKIRAGKANPRMLDSLLVDYYGSMTPLSQVANVSTPDARTIAIQPWEKSMIGAIEKAILAANLGMNPDNNGDIVRINVPPLTEERRRDLVKQVKVEGEDAKVSIRAARRDSNELLKKLKKDGLSEDLEKDAENEVQKITDSFIKQVEDQLNKKENDILTV